MFWESPMIEETAASNAALREGSLVMAALTTSTKARFFSEGNIPSDCWGWPCNERGKGCKWFEEITLGNFRLSLEVWVKSKFIVGHDDDADG